MRKKIFLLVLTPILTALLDVKLMLFGLAVIIFIDLLTGLNKSLQRLRIGFKPWKAKFWGTLRSRGMRETWRKTYEYGIGICVFVVLDVFVLKGSSFQLLGMVFTLTELAITIACIVETYSIFENIEAVTGRNFFKKILIFSPKLGASLADKKEEDGTNKPSV